VGRAERDLERQRREWPGQRIAQYREAYVRGQIDIDAFEALMAGVTVENADRYDPTFNMVADPHLISIEYR
jgi:hypothetical protein